MSNVLKKKVPPPPPQIFLKLFAFMLTFELVNSVWLNWCTGPKVRDILADPCREACDAKDSGSLNNQFVDL